jgi:hypothetical protein
MFKPIKNWIDWQSTKGNNNLEKCIDVVIGDSFTFGHANITRDEVAVKAAYYVREVRRIIEAL